MIEEHEDVEHEVTTFADLARGVRVYLCGDGTRREVPIEDESPSQEGRNDDR